MLLAVGDKEWRVREAAIRALGGLGASLAAHPRRSRPCLGLRAIKRSMSGDGDSGIRCTGRESGLPARGAQRRAFLAAGDENEDVRKAAIEALGGLGASLACCPRRSRSCFGLRAITSGMFGGGDRGVRRTGANLALLPEAFKAVLRAAGDENEYVRRAAIDGVRRTRRESG